MMVFWSLIWIGLLGVVVWAAVQWARSRPTAQIHQRPPAKSAYEILDERLARGEIDLDEYQRLGEALDDHTRRRV